MWPKRMKPEVVSWVPTPRTLPPPVTRGVPVRCPVKRRLPQPRGGGGLSQGGWWEGSNGNTLLSPGGLCSCHSR